MIGITRIDHAGSRTHCWRVCLQRRKQIYRRNFSNGRHGGRAQALRAAQVYRNDVLRTHPLLSKPAYCAIRKRNNSSGISGVTRHEVPGRTPTSPRHAFWLAQWPIGRGRAQMKKFSIRKYGEEGAFLRALVARQAALEALAHQTFPSSEVPRPGNAPAPLLG